MSENPLDNIKVHLALDDNGEFSTDPSDVLKLGQQLLIKSLMGMTDFGKSMPDNARVMNELIRTLNESALSHRKLDQEDKAFNHHLEMVETFKHFEQLSRGKNLYGDALAHDVDPYSSIDLNIDTEIKPGELDQGEIGVNIDDFIEKEEDN